MAGFKQARRAGRARGVHRRSVRRMSLLRLTGDAARDVDAVEAWLAADDARPGRPSRPPGSSGAPKQVVLSRGRGARVGRGLGGPARRRRGRGCSRSPRRTSPGSTSWSARWWPGTGRRCSATAPWPTWRLPAGSCRWCRPSCTAGSPRRTTARRWRPRHGAGRRRTGRPVAARARGRERGYAWSRRTASAETCGGCVYDGLPLDGVGLALAADGRIRISGPMLFDGYLDDEPATPRRARGRVVPHLRRRPARRGRAAAACSAGSTTWWSAAGSTCRPRPSPRGCGSTRPSLAAEVVGVPDAEWGNRVVAVRLAGRAGRDPLPRRPPATGWPSAPAGLGAARGGRRAGAADARQRQGRPARGPGRWPRRRPDEGLLDPDDHALPRDHRARGRAARGRGGLGRVEPVPRVRRPGGRAVAALRRGGRRG